MMAKQTKNEGRKLESGGGSVKKTIRLHSIVTL